MGARTNRLYYSCDADKMDNNIFRYCRWHAQCHSLVLDIGLFDLERLAETTLLEKTHLKPDGTPQMLF